LKSYIGDEDFMVTYGDGVADVDIKKLVDFHKKQDTIGTILGVHREGRFGLVDIDETTNKATDYHQYKIKEYKSEDFKDRVNGGFMVFKNKFFEVIEKGSMIEQSFVPLASSGELSVFPHEGKWKCMDTYKEVEELNEAWVKDPFWKVWR